MAFESEGSRYGFTIVQDAKEKIASYGQNFIDTPSRFKQPAGRDDGAVPRKASQPVAPCHGSSQPYPETMHAAEDLEGLSHQEPANGPSLGLSARISTDGM